MIILAVLYRILGYEGLEVVNPEGGTEDAEEEAKRGRWKHEVHYLLPYVLIVLYIFNSKFKSHYPSILVLIRVSGLLSRILC